jgi:ubiquitin-protein ligase
MIDLFCPECGAAFCVSAKLAGKEVACRSCGAGIIVPHVTAPPPIDSDPSAPAPVPEPDAPLQIDPLPENEPPSLSDDATAVDPVLLIDPAPLVDPPIGTGHPVDPAPPAALAIPIDFPPALDPPALHPPALEPPAPMDVPPPAGVAPPPASPPASPRKIPMRIRRLRSDAQQMARAFQDFELIRVVSSDGDPPDRYIIEYAVRGLQRIPGRREPVPRAFHQAQITLGAEYPRMPPRCRMLTPIFHPNIEPATICVGDHWTAGERLVDLVVRIAELIAFQAYNIQSPLDAEAAMWADLNVHDLPIDQRSMRPAGME